MTRPRKGGVRVDGDSKTGRNERYKLNGKETGNNEVDGEIDNKVDDKIEKKGQKISKSKNLFKKLPKSKKTVRSDFLTLGARLAFIKLR